MENAIMDFITFIKPILIFFSAGQITSKYVLNKNFKLRNVNKVIVPSELKQKYTKIEMKQMLSKKLEIQLPVNHFVNVITNKFNSSVLSNLYNNINDVKIKRDYVFSAIISADGYFTPKKNKIGILNINSIYHELFHLASARYDKENNITYSGFHQRYNKENVIDVGRALDEGYTEVLTHRYFNDANERMKDYTSYGFETNIAHKIEQIIGKDIMEELYLKSDLYGLVNELKKYSKEENVINFINDMDILLNNQFFILKSKKINIVLKEIYVFLIETYLNKIISEDITKKDIIEKASLFIEELDESIKVSGHRYITFNKKKFINRLDEIINLDERICLK